MEHNWIQYKNEIDQSDETSYYCSNCNMLIWTGIVNTPTGPILHIYAEDISFEYGDYTCEEYLIKNIIE